MASHGFMRGGGEKIALCLHLICFLALSSSLLFDEAGRVSGMGGVGTLGLSAAIFSNCLALFSLLTNSQKRLWPNFSSPATAESKL